MKSVKTIALAGSLALAVAMMGSAAFAATTAPAANEAHAKCEKEGKDKKLTAAALGDYVKKCEADAAKKK